MHRISDRYCRWETLLSGFHGSKLGASRFGTFDGLYQFAPIIQFAGDDRETNQNVTSGPPLGLSRNAQEMVMSESRGKPQLALEKEKRRNPRVEFSRGIPVRIVAIDGTWNRDCLMLDAADDSAKL